MFIFLSKVLFSLRDALFINQLTVATMASSMYLWRVYSSITVNWLNTARPHDCLWSNAYRWSRALDFYYVRFVNFLVPINFIPTSRFASYPLTLLPYIWVLLFSLSNLFTFCDFICIFYNHLTKLFSRFNLLPIRFSNQTYNTTDIHSYQI